MAVLEYPRDLPVMRSSTKVSSLCGSFPNGGQNGERRDGATLGKPREREALREMASFDSPMNKNHR